MEHENSKFFPQPLMTAYVRDPFDCVGLQVARPMIFAFGLVQSGKNVGMLWPQKGGWVKEAFGVDIIRG